MATCIGEFWISGFIVELWCDLLTLTAVASNPDSSEKQILHYKLLMNMTVQSVQQIRWRVTSVKSKEQEC